MSHRHKLDLCMEFPTKFLEFIAKQRSKLERAKITLMLHDEMPWILNASQFLAGYNLEHLKCHRSELQRMCSMIIPISLNSPASNIDEWYLTHLVIRILEAFNNFLTMVSELLGAYMHTLNLGIFSQSQRSSNYYDSSNARIHRTRFATLWHDDMTRLNWRGVAAWIKDIAGNSKEQPGSHKY